MQKIFSEFYSPSLRSDLKTFRLDGAELIYITHNKRWWFVKSQNGFHPFQDGVGNLR